MSDIVHGGITEPCSSLWRRGNGHLVSLRTYSSCVLVRSGIELFWEGVDDMDLVGAAVTLDRAAMGWSNRGFLSCGQRVLAKETSTTGQNTDTPLRYAN